MREIKFCFEIFKENFRVAGAKQGQASLEGRAERSRRQGGSLHHLVSLMRKALNSILWKEGLWKDPH